MNAKPFGHLSKGLRLNPRIILNYSNMYEDSWYNAFVPRSHHQPDRSKHRRRESLLKQPNVSHI